MIAANGRITLLLLVDHQVLFGQGMVGLFRRTPDIDVVAAEDGPTGAVARARDLCPDVVWLDTALPAGMAFDAADRISLLCPGTKILFVDDTVRTANVFEALRVSGAAYWTKQSGFDEICEAVRGLSRGRRSFCPEVTRRLMFTAGGLRFRPILSSPLLESLSPGQAELMVHVARGLTLAECARKMNMSRSAVDNCMCRLRKKLGIRNIANLVLLAVREGLLESKPEIR